METSGCSDRTGTRLLGLRAICAALLSLLCAANPVAAGATGSGGPAPPGRSLLSADLPATPTHVVLLSVDALRADFLSYAGHGQPTSPFIDSLAASSVVFTDAYATSSWTSPSLASLLTSVEPSVHGLMQITKDPTTGMKLGYEVLAPSFVTLAETFEGAGWLTVGVPSNLNVRQGRGFEQGFGQYYGKAEFRNWETLNQIVLNQIRSHRGFRGLDQWHERRAFLWVHYFDPHDSYEARRPWIEQFAPDWASNRSSYPAGLTVSKLNERFPKPDAETLRRLRALYESEIRATDEGIRELCRSLGLADDDVLLIFTADHGDEFLDHGRLGHRNSLCEELVHVPLFIRWPRVLRPGRIETPVSHLDLYPTLVELLGLPDPGALRGASLLPLLRGETPPAPRPIFTELDLETRKLRAVRQENWKLIWDSEKPGAVQLYDLATDRGELTNLALRRPEISRALRDTLMRWQQNLPARSTDLQAAPALSPEELERMRSLGYIR